MFSLKKLFGKPASSDTGSSNTPMAVNARSSQEMRGDPSLVRVFDGYGREMFIERETWRKDVLPQSLKDQWNHPEKLYSVLVSALHDGFYADIEGAAKHLKDTDPGYLQGSTVYAIVLTKLGKLDAAERVLTSYIAAQGEDAVIANNLAKVFAARNEQAKAEAMLWHSLELDPNSDNSFQWHLALSQEREGADGSKHELHRIAQLPGSWRAQLWLARSALAERDLAGAVALYHDALDHAQKPLPTDLLKQMSGDLGNAGYLAELIKLAAPYFDARQHGLLVGNNLIKANLDLGQIDSAAKILEDLFKLQRMDWKEQLSSWETEIAKARIAVRSINAQIPVESEMLTVDGPVWLSPSPLLNALFTAKPVDAPQVSFLGGSASGYGLNEFKIQLTDTPGRLSRAIPLFLAEQAYFRSTAQVQTLTPCIEGNGGGFVVSGKPFADSDAARYARLGQPRSLCVVVAHLVVGTEAEPWGITLRVIRTGDAECIGSLTASFEPSQPEQALIYLAEELTSLLTSSFSIEAEMPNHLYEIPSGPGLSDYLVRLEQLLTLRITDTQKAAAQVLHGEREILQGNVELCVSNPASVVTRILLARSLGVLNRSRAEIASEFAAKVQLLQSQYPLAGSSQGIVDSMIRDALKTE